MKEQITNRIVDAERSNQRTAPFPAMAQGKVTRYGGSTIVPIGQTHIVSSDFGQNPEHGKDTELRNSEEGDHCRSLTPHGRRFFFDPSPRLPDRLSQTAKGYETQSQKKALR